MVFKHIKNKLLDIEKNKLISQIDFVKSVIENSKNYKTIVNETDYLELGLKKFEEVLLIVDGVVLLETKRLPGRFEGSTSGVSFKVTDRITIRGSKFSGQYVPGAEQQTVVDSGKFFITNQRASFFGTKHSRDFPWNKLLGYTIGPLAGVNDSFVLYLPVSNRQKISGIGVGKIEWDKKYSWIELINQRMALAQALYREKHNEFIENLEKELVALEVDLKEKFTDK